MINLYRSQIQTSRDSLKTTGCLYDLEEDKKSIICNIVIYNF